MHWQARQLEREEDFGHYKPWLVWETNRLAGHGPGEPGLSLARLLSEPPHAVIQPPPVGDGDVCIQSIDNFAARTNGGKRPALTAEQQQLLPCFRPAVVPKELRQVPIVVVGVVVLVVLVVPPRPHAHPPFLGR